MKTIRINHIAKIEGHSSFAGALINGDFAQARMETEEGARLIEGILLGRKYYEAPIITARICGVCPIVHNLASIKAIEQVFNVKPTEEIILLRKMLLCAQWIHSHALHVFFFSFPDIVGISNNFDFVKKYPDAAKSALEVRDFGVKLARVIGGRAVHPINSVIGGFNVEPDYAELSSIMDDNKEILAKAITLFYSIAKKKLPSFNAPTNYISLRNQNEYASYDGKIYFSDNQSQVQPDKFMQFVLENITPHERVKRVSYLDRAFFVGALARINNNFKLLSDKARKTWKSLGEKSPCYNSFYNIFAQAVEIIHCIEESGKLYKRYQKKRKETLFEKRLKVKFNPNQGKGCAVLEAPRGLLFHQYELDKQGNITYSNIITPTAMFLANLEKDLELFLVENQKLDDKKRDLLIKMLIRAYDPCISCATH